VSFYENTPNEFLWNCGLEGFAGYPTVCFSALELNIYLLLYWLLIGWQYILKLGIKHFILQLNSVIRLWKGLNTLCRYNRYNVTVNSQELVGTTEYLILWARCRMNRSRYNGVRLCLNMLLGNTVFAKASFFVLNYHCFISQPWRLYFLIIV
jgi:hypothetical protein